jgi:hypothetical protein
VTQKRLSAQLDEYHRQNRVILESIQTQQKTMQDAQGKEYEKAATFRHALNNVLGRELLAEAVRRARIERENREND